MRFFRRKPSEIRKEERLNFIYKKCSDGSDKRKISKYCHWLDVSRQAFYKYINKPKRIWKYENLSREIREIIAEDEYNDSYGKRRILESLQLRHKDNDLPSVSTIYRIMQEMGIKGKKKHKPNGITKADKEARKSDDLLKRNFFADNPFKKIVTDITEIPVKGGKLYVSAIFDCFNLECLGLSMDTNMKAELCVKTLADAKKNHPKLRGAVLHSDRGSQYTSREFRKALARHGLIQSMNSDGGRCHDNARCESMWARMKEELLYDRYDTKKMTADAVKTLVWRYYMSYWNNRRICSAIGGMPPRIKLEQYLNSKKLVA